MVISITLFLESINVFGLSADRTVRLKTRALSACATIKVQVVSVKLQLLKRP